jgi:hypothetical protein
MIRIKNRQDYSRDVFTGPAVAIPGDNIEGCLLAAHKFNGMFT